MTAPPIAFYAPLKSPHHPTPSGDRTMARLLLRALGEAGWAAELASELRSREPAGDTHRQAEIRRAGEAEADRLTRLYAARPIGARPQAWLTYHSYYKAPDWIGPTVAARLGIPYLLAEATRARKRAGGPWDLAHRGAEAALDAARVVFALTERDRPALDRDRLPGQVIVDLPPFLDLAEWPARPSARSAASHAGPVRLLAVGMMREGDKLASYRGLAAALARLGDDDWRLDIVGDGPARDAVARLFAFAGARASFAGRLDGREALAGAYDAADLLVWPAVNEAYGLALLEAQARGCPVLAGRVGGVPSVVRHGETGILTEPGDPAAFAAALDGLRRDRPRLAVMGEAARRFVEGERTLVQASRILAGAIAPLLPGRAAA